MKRAVVIGGGTGTYIILSNLKNYPITLSAIISMADSGGSTGRLRDQYGTLPAGDIRQCLVALSDAPTLWRELFLYRFETGDLSGHNFGNIFLTALEMNAKNYREVIETASYILHTRGSIIPVTYKNVNLSVTYSDGKILTGEKFIDSSKHVTARIKKATLIPQAPANPYALHSIKKANYIILGPGDLYTSIVPNLLAVGMRKAIKKSKAKLIYISNLMTKRGQTNNYTISDHVLDLQNYLGRTLDIIIINNGKINPKIISYYKKYSEHPVVDDMPVKLSSTKLIRENLVQNILLKKHDTDSAIRSLVRHNSTKLCRVLWNILNP